MQGAFAVPMKSARKWQHEKIWLVFAVSGLVVLLWIVILRSRPLAIGLSEFSVSLLVWWAHALRPE